LQARDWGRWIDLWADDAVLEFPFAPAGQPGRFVGKQAILAYMSATTERIEVDSVTNLEIFPMLDPEAIVVDVQIAGHLLGNGAPYDQRYVTIFQFKAGKIQRYREFWNPLISIDAHGSRQAWMAAFASRVQAAPA
jgi:uncharacterized protein